MAYIASLLLGLTMRLVEAPLFHCQDSLIPVKDVIPDLKIEDKDRSAVLYGFKKNPIALDWRLFSEKIDMVITADHEKDQATLHEKLADAIQAIQRKLNVAIEEFPGEITMLQWADNIYRHGWGDYDSLNGGYGTMQDPRTGNIFCLFICNRKRDGKRIAIFEISFCFALVPITDKKVPEWSKKPTVINF